jgi:lipoprotein-anchoring transpeptidase ErfK/SrfK
MSSLRTIFGIVVLAAILYAVYVSITKQPKNDAPPPEVANGLAAAPPGDMLTQAIPQFPQNPGAAAAPPVTTGSGAYPPATNGSAFPGVGPSPSSAAGGSPWSAPPPSPSNPPATSNAGAWPPSPSQTPASPSYPPATPTTPSNPVASPPPSGIDATTANPPARSALPYPSTNMPESGVMPAMSIDSVPKMPSTNTSPTRLPDPATDYRDKINGSAAPPGTAGHPEFTAMLKAAYADIAQGRMAEIHAALSRFYGEPRLTAAESQALVDLLDRLAGTVIYSRQHLLESPYRVQGDDTLERIARPYEVSPSLLAKINGIRDPRQLQPGMELKVFHGPFDAVIDLGRYELTLFLKNRYAGRFPIGVGGDFMQYMQREARAGPLPTLEGQYTVRDKQFSPIYFGPDRVTMSPSDPNYPLGRRWIDLGSQLGAPVGIHGTNDPRNIGHTAGRGSIFLTDRDIDDIYDILTVGSKVTIRR